MIDIGAIDRIAYAEIGTARSHPFKEPGNKYEHGVRVSKICEVLCRETGVGFTPVIDAAARLHDICNGQPDHAVLGAERARELLSGKDVCAEEELDLICSIIAVHDDRELEGLSPAVMIHQDADLLDHFATFTVWAFFQYAFRDGWSFRETAEKLIEENESSYNRYFAQLHYDVSRRIYREKRAYKRSFAERMLREARGEIVSFGIPDDTK